MHLPFEVRSLFDKKRDVYNMIRSFQARPRLSRNFADDYREGQSCVCVCTTAEHGGLAGLFRATS